MLLIIINTISLEEYFMENKTLIKKRDLKKTTDVEQEAFLELYRGEFDDCDNSPYSTQCTC